MSEKTSSSTPDNNDNNKGNGGTTPASIKQAVADGVNDALKSGKASVDVKVTVTHELAPFGKGAGTIAGNMALGAAEAALVVGVGYGTYRAVKWAIGT